MQHAASGLRTASLHGKTAAQQKPRVCMHFPQWPHGNQLERRIDRVTTLKGFGCIAGLFASS